ncbi:MAG TPA: glycosyltransferase family 39 protein [Mycobacteriales bacterium]|nr:glycosyltransferase family 39 protein [Mycobacteriales bacterium]
MVTTTATLDRPLATGAPRGDAAAPSLRRLVHEQGVVIAGQVLSGVGNFAFLLAGLRLVDARGFARLATFLALYLLLLMPLFGLSAGSSAEPGATRRSAQRGLLAGVAAGVALGALSPFLSGPLHLPVVMVAVLAAALPGAAPLALVRGRLFGEKRPLAAASTLVAEPTLRLGLGLPLLAAMGPIGGAVGVVAGGYAGLAMGLLATARNRAPAAVVSRAQPRLPVVTVAIFTLLAIVQSQDVVWGNGLLNARAAGLFAALSTVGGIVAFTTSTVPLVLLPRAADPGMAGRKATRLALVITAGVAVAATIAGAVVPSAVYTAVLGNRYGGVARLAAPYLAAMGLLGIGRVLVARLVAQGRRRSVLVITFVAAAAQAAIIVLALRTPRAISLSTLAAAAFLTAGTAVLIRRPARARTSVAVVAWWRSTPVVLGLMMGAGLAVRLLITRGLWLDEAISVTQVRMPFGAMLHNLRSTDVHPPGYFSLLWAWVHVFGSGPLSVRLPSILISLVLIPALYLAGRELYNHRTGMAAAALGIAAPQVVWYGQEARMYALFMLLVTLSVWAQSRALRTGRLPIWLVHGALCAALIYTQYFSVLVILAQQLVTVAVLSLRRHRRDPVRSDVIGWLLGMAVMAVLVAPLVPFALNQYDVNQAAGRGFGSPTATNNGIVQPGRSVSPYVVIANMLWAVWGYHSNTVMTALGALWPMGMLLTLALLGRGRSRATALCLTAALLPVAVMYAIGTEKRFLFDLRYFIGCVPLLLLVVARATTSWARTRLGSALLVGAVGISLVAGLVDQQLNGDNPRRYDFAPALQRISAQAGPNDELLLAPPYLHDIAHYYAPNVRQASMKGSPTAVVDATSRDRRVFVLASFFELGGTQQSKALMAVLREHRRLVAQWRLDNVRVWEFR